MCYAELTGSSKTAEQSIPPQPATVTYVIVDQSRGRGECRRSSNLADTLMDHLEPLRKRVLSMPVKDAAPPWTRRIVASVGGLTEIGFADDSDLLLVVTSTGRSLFDCISGERIARNRDEPDDSWYDERRLRAFGIGPVDGKTQASDGDR